MRFFSGWHKSRDDSLARLSEKGAYTVAKHWKERKREREFGGKRERVSENRIMNVIPGEKMGKAVPGQSEHGEKYE